MSHSVSLRPESFHAKHLETGRQGPLLSSASIRPRQSIATSIHDRRRSGQGDGTFPNGAGSCSAGDASVPVRLSGVPWPRQTALLGAQSR